MHTGLFGSALLAVHLLVSLVSHSEQIKGAPSAMNFAAPRIVAGSLFPPVKRLPRRAPPPAGDTAGVGGAMTARGPRRASPSPERRAARRRRIRTRQRPALARRGGSRGLGPRVARSFSRKPTAGDSLQSRSAGRQARLRSETFTRQSARRHERNAHSCASTASSSFEETGTRRGERSRTHHATDRAVARVQVVRVLGVEVLQLGVRVDGRGGAGGARRGRRYGELIG